MRTGWAGKATVGGVAMAAVLAASLLLPGRPAEALDCAPPRPEPLYLELESASVDGVPVNSANGTWAKLVTWEYWTGDRVDSVNLEIEEPWADSLGLGGQRHARTEK